MKLICTQENLLKGLSTVAISTRKTSSLPILAHVLINAEEGNIRLTTTNLEIGTTCSIRGKVEEKGKIAVPVHLLLSYINNLPPLKMSLEKEKENSLKISCENFEARIKCLDVSEFPIIPKIDSEPFCQINSNVLREGLSQVVFSAAQDESRPELTGVYIKAEESQIRMAATDSYRLAEKIIKPETLIKATEEMIVPATTMQELARILSKEEGKVDFFTSENQIKFRINNTELISRLTEGKYPDYLKIIPEKFSTKVKIDTEEFNSALKTANLFSKSDANEVEISVNKDEGKVIISAESGQLGKSNSILNSEVEGKDETVIFNCRYILEGMSSISAEKIYFMLSGEMGPAAIKPVDDPSYIYIIMPIKK